MMYFAECTWERRVDTSQVSYSVITERQNLAFFAGGCSSATFVGGLGLFKQHWQ